MKIRSGRKTILSVLREVKAVLSTPKTWCKGHAAVNSVGESCNPVNQNPGDMACRWCLVGAIVKALGKQSGWPLNQQSNLARGVYKAVSAAVPPGWNLASWNDAPKTKHKDVLALLDRAIATQKRKAA